MPNISFALIVLGVTPLAISSAFERPLAFCSAYVNCNCTK